MAQQLREIDAALFILERSRLRGKRRPQQYRRCLVFVDGERGVPLFFFHSLRRVLIYKHANFVRGGNEIYAGGDSRVAIRFDDARPIEKNAPVCDGSFSFFFLTNQAVGRCL